MESRSLVALGPVDTNKKEGVSDALASPSSQESGAAVLGGKPRPSLFGPPPSFHREQSPVQGMREGWDERDGTEKLLDGEAWEAKRGRVAWVSFASVDIGGGWGKRT